MEDLGEITFGYCTEFIVNLEHELEPSQVAEFKAYLESLGDSIVLVADEELVKVHVHTNDPGLAIQKALTFGDLEIAEKVMASWDFEEMKALGRQVRGYDNTVWNGIRQIVVYEGLLAKFGQNKELKQKLLDTGDALLAEAKAQGATMLVTEGGAQTNHGRQTAGVAAKLGMKCVIACVDNYPGEISANVLLDRLMGAEVVFQTPTGEPGQADKLIKMLIEKYEAQGEKVYYNHK